MYFIASKLGSFCVVQSGVNRLGLRKCNSHLLLYNGCLRQKKLSFSTLKDNSNQMVSVEELDADVKKKIFNTILMERDPEVSFIRKKIIESKAHNLKLAKYVHEGAPTPLPLSLRLLEDSSVGGNNDILNDQPKQFVEDSPPHYPFAENVRNQLRSEIVLGGVRARRGPDFRKKLAEELQEKKKRMEMWMSDYEMFSENIESSMKSLDGINYGTSDPQEPVSNISCGGCGALLHCKDHSIPGYLPRELFAQKKRRELKSLICQRCHFLKEFNVALDVCVTPDEYLKIISCIQGKHAIAVLMIDLLDFPCSIWPGIMEIIGSKRPVVIVGNKIDLIPGDHEGYLKHIKETLQVYVEKMGIDRANIKHVALVSACTGFGVEDLITHLHQVWDSNSDVFLLGCTNVGKSSLFNMLLQSDFCKVLAVDLVQRATTSEWPGTTLNLLKFPILRPEGWRLALRRKRLDSEASIRRQEKDLQKEQLRRRRIYHMPSLIEYVGRTFPKKNEDDAFSGILSSSGGKPEQIGIDEEDDNFAKGRWCYDTPGVMHPDQILNILTTEELIKVIPKSPIVPRFFVLKPGRSLFLAGLGRIDLISSSKDKSSRLAVFSSSHLPVTIVETPEADEVYGKLLGTDLTAVPCGGPQRLADWPGLSAKDEIISVTGVGWKECCADIVLSSAGWVAVSGRENMEMSFRVWTPLAQGVHLRQPSLLPFAINFRGKRITHTPTYQTGRAGFDTNESDPDGSTNYA